MGTPYGGNALMAYYLATGPPAAGSSRPSSASARRRFDLGTLGSALWSSRIPRWAGNDVFGDAHNMGVTESECHTGGMHHLAQTANYDRNDILDREGRPSK